MAHTLEHKVTFTPYAETTPKEMLFASARNAIGFSRQFVKERLWTNVHMFQLIDGKWVADTENENILMNKASSVARKETSMNAVPALRILNELVSTLEKQAAKAVLTTDQKQELVDYALSALVATGVSHGDVVKALTTAYPHPGSVVTSGVTINEATEKVPAIQPMPQVAVTPRETPVENKPVERLHVQVPDKEAQRGGLFGRKS